MAIKLGRPQSWEEVDEMLARLQVYLAGLGTSSEPPALPRATNWEELEQTWATLQRWFRTRELGQPYLLMPRNFEELEQAVAALQTWLNAL